MIQLDFCNKYLMGGFCTFWVFCFYHKQAVDVIHYFVASTITL